jgi:molybdate transport system substrate-binding protein
MRLSRRLGVVAMIATAVGCGGSAPKPLLISAASDLQEVSEPLADQFRKETGILVQFNFAASGTLAQQIEAGARPDVFASANVDFVERLVKAGFIEPGTMRIYAKGRLVVVTAKSDRRLQLLDELKGARFARIAIANPETAPYGAAGMQAIEAAGLLESLKPRLIIAENVRQAFQYVKLGEVDAAFVSASLVADHATSALVVSESLHQPLLQATAPLKNSLHPKEARQFVEFLCSEAGRSLLKKHGLEAPPTTMVKP